MGHELRCDNKLHAIMVNGLFEVKCDSRFCGAKPGVTILHRFDPLTGEFTTLKFRDPQIKKGTNGTRHSKSTAIRTP